MSGDLSVNELRRRARVALSVPVMVTALKQGANIKRCATRWTSVAAERCFGYGFHSPSTVVCAWISFIAIKSLRPE